MTSQRNSEEKRTSKLGEKTLSDHEGTGHYGKVYVFTFLMFFNLYYSVAEGFFCKQDGFNTTLRASKGKEELPGWADNIDFDQD